EALIAGHADLVAQGDAVAEDGLPIGRIAGPAPLLRGIFARGQMNGYERAICLTGRRRDAWKSKARFDRKSISPERSAPHACTTRLPPGFFRSGGWPRRRYWSWRSERARWCRERAMNAWATARVARRSFCDQRSP